MKGKGFVKPTLSKEEIENLKELGRLCRGDILKMTTLANSGHPGGSMSSVDIYLVLYSYANITPQNPEDPLRDRIIVSHGHTSPALYSVLGRLGFVNLEEAISGFRRIGSLFEGHIVRSIPGIEWSTGNLGQGLSAGCGMALAAKIKGEGWHTFVAMSDGEQAKGQVSEARRFARKFGLTNLTVIIDYNRLQINGWLDEVMPQNIKGCYEADGWKVLEVDGHDYGAIYEALKEAREDEENLVAILAHTVMGKGVSFMENEWDYHGRALKPDEYKRALEELGIEDDLEKYRTLRENFTPTTKPRSTQLTYSLEVGEPRIYTKEDKTDNRTAFGKALGDLASLNKGKKDRTPIAVFDCDLAPSVRAGYFKEVWPENFFESGVQEHNTATIAGALSTQGVIVFFADFGVFGVDETYNQHRLNDMNFTNLKLVCTHCGVDVGKDGKTHQCTDYLGVFKNLYGFKVIAPADPNQTDRVIRYVTPQKGNWLIVMGRSKIPVILREDGEPYFAKDYKFIYGKADLIREGEDGALLTYGSLVHKAVKIWEELKKKGISLQVWNFACLTDLDLEALRKASSTGYLFTYEDHHIGTGLGSSVGMIIAEKGWEARLFRSGLTYYGGSADPEDLYRQMRLDVESMVEKIEKVLRGKD